MGGSGGAGDFTMVLSDRGVDIVVVLLCMYGIYHQRAAMFSFSVSFKIQKPPSNV